MVARTSDSSWDIPIGVPVFTADGQRLGKVTEADINGLIIEDGFFFFRRVYRAKLSDVERYEDGALSLKLAMDQVEQQ